MRISDLVEDCPVWTEEAPLSVWLEAHMPGLTLSPGVSVQPVLVSAGEARVRRGVVDGIVHPRLTCVHIVIDTSTENGAGSKYVKQYISWRRLNNLVNKTETSRACIRLRHFVFAPLSINLSNI